MAIQETHPRREATYVAPKVTVSVTGRLLAILGIMVLESIALFSVPGLTATDAVGIFAASYAAGTLVLIV